jgi:hypothetical protein
MADTTGNGARWYDPHKVTLSLFGVVFLLVAAWGGVVYGMAHAGEMKNVEQDGRLKTLEASFDKIDTKLDKVLERQNK